MNAIEVPNTRSAGRLQGIALTAIFIDVPTFTGAVLLLKLFGSQSIVGDTGGAAFFVFTTSLLAGIAASYLGPKYTRFFAASYEPLFFEVSLTVKEKLLRWQAQPKTTLQLVTQVMMLSVLAVAVVSFR